MPAALPASPELLARTQRNLVVIHWRCLEQGPRPRRRDWPGATALASHLPTEATNTLFVEAPPDDPARLLAEAREFFDGAPAWRVTAPERLRDAIEPAALSAGLRPAVVVPRMLLDPLPAAPSLPAGLEIRRVTTAVDLRDFCTAAGRAFQIPRWYLRVAFAGGFADAAEGKEPVRLFVGYEAGRPVATAAQATSDGVAGIFFVGSVPEARRKGFGGALTWAAIEDGRSLGAQVAWLQSTPMGRPLYERLGFRWVQNDVDWFALPHGAAKVRLFFRVLALALARRHTPRPPGPETP